jgi:hypothetical protein
VDRTHCRSRSNIAGSGTVASITTAYFAERRPPNAVASSGTSPNAPPSGNSSSCDIGELFARMPAATTSTASSVSSSR